MLKYIYNTHTGAVLQSSGEWPVGHEDQIKRRRTCRTHYKSYLYFFTMYH